MDQAIPTPLSPATPEDAGPIVLALPKGRILEDVAAFFARAGYDLSPALGDMLARGYVVVAPDYPGLGSSGVHPFLIGQPYRLAAFEEALAYITGHDKVWLATGREIAAHFNEHYHDAFAAAAQPIGEVAA